MQVKLSAKPKLTPLNKQQRLLFAKPFVITDYAGQNRFKTVYDTIHLDEKWFYMAKIKNKVILAPEETPPLHRVKKKTA